MIVDMLSNGNNLYTILEDFVMHKTGSHAKLRLPNFESMDCYISSVDCNNSEEARRKMIFIDLPEMVVSVYSMCNPNLESRQNCYQSMLDWFQVLICILITSAIYIVSKLCIVCYFGRTNGASLWEATLSMLSKGQFPMGINRLQIVVTRTCVRKAYCSI